jgi:ketosteroid isomerase-like protein
MKIFFFLCGFLFVSCSPQNQFVRADLDFSQYSLAHGPAEAFTKYFAADGFVLRAGANPVTGRDSIRTLFANFANGATLTWEPLEVDCSETRDIGFTIGNHQTKITDSAGTVRTIDSGQYVTLWKRQPDQSLKVIADMGSPHPTPHDTTWLRVIRIPLRVEESVHSDFGLSFGSLELKMQAATGEKSSHFGKYVYAWRRNADGSKKTLIDLSNASPTPQILK